MSSDFAFYLLNPNRFAVVGQEYFNRLVEDVPSLAQAIVSVTSPTSWGLVVIARQDYDTALYAIKERERLNKEDAKSKPHTQE